MKKIVVVILLCMLCVGVQARSEEPKYKIISHSFQDKDIQEMYEVKTRLLKDYKEWVQGVYNKEQVLVDHQKDYHATFKQGVYTIVLGDGKGKSLSGELKVNYCESSQDIKKKSLFFDWLF